MTINEIWEGAYKGLYGEVVTEDIYKIRLLKFTPDVIFDLGANVGTFSRFARKLFPNANIIAIEPDIFNVKYFHEFNNPYELKVRLDILAIGQGECFRCEGAINGAHEVYVTKQLGFENIKASKEIKLTAITTILLDRLCNGLINNKKYIFKIDIEGAETALFTHEPSKQILRNADYIAMELHFHALENNEEVKKVTLEFLDSLKETHNTEYIHPMFYATKKC